MAVTPKKDFIFRKHMSIGEADAENDRNYLSDCFVDIGDYGVLVDTSAPQSILLGRTGVGKSALIDHLEENKERVIRIEPEELALRHISNSTILKFFESLNVNLDIFYSLLWQHTFAVELIKNNYGIDSQQSKIKFLESLRLKLSGNQKKLEAIKYIEEWGDKFWVDTETRIKQFTEKLENNLRDTINANVPGVKLECGDSIRLSKEKMSEVVHYANKVVSSVQIEKLARIIKLLAEDIFTDPQKEIFILIDRLDENWVDDELRYKLVRSLIETIKKFRNVKPVKIVVTLRDDLLNLVLRKTLNSGFQPEKYNSLFLKVGWNKEQIKNVLDKRINFLLKHKYTNSEVCFDDVFPAKIDKVSTSDYILDRTLLRPRDAIIFVNECLIEAQGKTEISNSIIKIAEQSYSHGRLDSLKYEWRIEHPYLGSYVELLAKKEASFKVDKIKKDELELLILKLEEDGFASPDIVCDTARRYMKAKYPLTDKLLEEFKHQVLFVLYRTGIAGVKIDGVSSVKWVHNRTQNLTAQKIQNNSIIYIHKMLWRALAIDKRSA